jgi:hypothetical protein
VAELVIMSVEKVLGERWSSSSDRKVIEKMIAKNK